MEGFLGRVGSIGESVNFVVLFEVEEDDFLAGGSRLLVMLLQVLKRLLSVFLGFLALLWGEVLKSISGWRAGAAVGFLPLAILLEASRKVLEGWSVVGGWRAGFNAG